MTKFQAVRVAEKVAWRAWPEPRTTCLCGTVIEAADHGLLGYAVRAHLLHYH